MRIVSPLLFRQHLSLRLPEACTHEVGRSIRNHTTSSLRNHRFSMARYRFYTRARTLALCPLGIRVFAVEGLSSAFLLKKTGSRPSSLPYNNVYSITIYILAKQAVEVIAQNLMDFEQFNAKCRMQIEKCKINNASFCAFFCFTFLHLFTLLCSRCY